MMARMAWLLLLCSIAPAWAACEKTVRWNPDPPFHFRNAQGEVRGVYPELAREALKRVGCEARFLEMPWARALVELERGNLDILPDAYRRPDRDEYALFSRPVRRTLNYVYMSPAAHAKYGQLRELSELRGTGFKLGVQISVSYGAEYDRLVKVADFASQLVQVTNYRGAIQMVEAGRLDGIIATDSGGTLELRHDGKVLPLKRSSLLASDEVAMFALGKRTNTADFVRSFNTALEAMMADGSYRSILERHLACRVSVARLGCDL